MCGIAGLIAARGVDEALLARMTGTLAHRGPDGDGLWVDAETGVGLGHRRLAIVDLSPAGAQPMHSADGRLVLTLNGEIYNHPELRRALEQEGAAPVGGWRGHSDHEVFLQAIATWGLVPALKRSVGMFAFALWDRAARTLSLVRDRFGEKPLYYGWAGRDLLFGSELKALRAHPRFDAPVSRQAVRLYASRTYIPAPLSIYEGVFKVEPGCVLTIGAGAAPLTSPPRDGETSGVRLERYWSYRDAVRDGLADPIADERAVLERLEPALATAIAGQSMADVPVGAFLSGGIDSSTVCALYQKYSPVPVRTFSIGFEEAEYNEAAHARRVAEQLGTVHHEHYVTVRETRDVIPLLPAMYDEPFADSSQIPTFLVSQLARREVTVALSGDGGDELFGGYTRHWSAPRLWRYLQKIPRPVRAAGGSPLRPLPLQVWRGIADLLLPGGRPEAGSKLQKAVRVASSAGSFEQFYCSFLDEWSYQRSPVLGGEAVDSRADFDFDVGTAAPDAVRAMYCDAVGYLPGDILAKVDRAAMAVSLETRVPFLDHRVAELAARIPIGMKIEGSEGKQILRRLLYTLLPRELVDRPKAGFGIPVGAWLRGPLRPWAEELLDSARMRGEGLFDPAIVHRRWREHLSGARDSTVALWAVLMFQAWLRGEEKQLASAA